jgi:hypothetical protein
MECMNGRDVENGADMTALAPLLLQLAPLGGRPVQSQSGDGTRRSLPSVTRPVYVRYWIPEWETSHCCRNEIVNGFVSHIFFD